MNIKLNGSGKSTFLKLILDAIQSNKGFIIKTNGKIMRLALGIGFDKNLSARENIYLNDTILGLFLKQIRSNMEEILDFSELHEYLDTPVRFFSSEMVSRFSFTTALRADADILLINELFGAEGDSSFMQKSQSAFEENILRGKTNIHGSHSMVTIKNHCDKVLLLDKGKGTFYDDPLKVISVYNSL